MFWNPEFGNIQPRVIGVVFRNPVPESMIGVVRSIPAEQRGSRGWKQWIDLIAGGVAFSIVTGAGILVMDKVDSPPPVTMAISLILATAVGSSTQSVVEKLLRRPRN